jgi:hypothetical protein
MTIQVGTRQRASAVHTRIDQGHQTRGFSRDVGMSKNISASITFTTSPAEASAANGTFAAFAVQDVVLIEGCNINNGYFTVTGIDTVNSAYLVLDPPPAAEGPITATVRTA